MNYRFLFLWAAAWIAIPAAWADHAPQHKTTSGMDVYYGIVPAEVVEMHVKEHGAPTMHKKKLFSKGAHHLVVTLYDAKTSQRINDAVVSAKVAPLGLNPESKNLETMKVGDATSYGNYFSMPPGDTPYRITLSIKRPADHQAADVEFDYRHAAGR
jgi:hypothetical protein